MYLPHSTIPDSAVPERWTGLRGAPLRLAMASLFYAGYALGRCVEAIRRSPAKRLLVIRTDGVGESLLFEPALRTLAEQFPGHQLHLWAPRAVCELYRATQYVSRIKAIPAGGETGAAAYFASPIQRITTGYLVGRWSFDVALYPAESPEPVGNWLIAAVRSAERWIVDGDTERQTADQKQRASGRATRILSRAHQGGHELQRNAHLAGQWGGRLDPAGKPLVHVADDAAQIACGRVRHWRNLALQHGATGLVAVFVRETPAADVWAGAIDDLWHAHRLMPVLLNPPADAAPAKAVAARLKGVPFVDIESDLEALTRATLIGRIDAVLTADADTAHVALAQNVPTVVLNGPTSDRFLPWPGAANQRVLRGGVVEPAEIVDACLDVTGRKMRLRVAS